MDNKAKVNSMTVDELLNAIENPKAAEDAAARTGVSKADLVAQAEQLSRKLSQKLDSINVV